jgi:hypothetical protein
VTSSSRSTSRSSATQSRQSCHLPITDPAALRAADWLAILPDDSAAPADKIQRRREEIGFSYFGVEVSDALAPVLGGHNLSA